MMKKVNMIIGAAVAATMCASSAHAATTTFLAVGSSAIWQTAAIGAYNLAKAKGTAFHYTIKGTCGTGNCAQIVDSRDLTHIANQSGSLWIVWDTAGDVWTDLSVDSVVGDRSFLAAPRAKLVVSTAVESTPGLNLISSTFLGNTSDAKSVPSNVVTQINNALLSAAFTDIRPEDALFATNRAISTPTAFPGGLGYTGPTANVGADIFSTYTAGLFAQPVLFNLSGRPDPISKQTVPASTTIAIGASPIVFFDNRTAALDNLGTNLTITQADDAFSTCGVVNGVNVTTVIREPISGTMNTTEFTVFLNSTGPKFSQERGIPPSDNPVNISCPGNTHRTRAIGTGDLVGALSATTVPSVAYAFFGYGNFTKIAAKPQYTYFTLNGIDPIFATHPSNGELPACVGGACGVPVGTSFPNLRNGTYPAWSVLRAVTDASGTNFSATNTLVGQIEADIDTTVPDFVPYNKVGNDPGLPYYRSHYTQSGVNPNNGLNGQTEAGGDMGGCIEKKTVNVTGCKDFTYPPAQ